MNVRHIYLTRITSRRVRARCYNGDHRSGEESSLGNNAQECSWQEEEDATAGLTKTSRGSRHPLLPHLDLLCITCTERTSRIFNEAQKLPNMEVLSTHL